MVILPHFQAVIKHFFTFCSLFYNFFRLLQNLVVMEFGDTIFIYKSNKKETVLPQKRSLFCNLCDFFTQTI